MPPTCFYLPNRPDEALLDVQTLRSFREACVSVSRVTSHIASLLPPPSLKAGSQRNIVTGDDASNTTMAVSTPDFYYIIAMNPDTDAVNATLTFPEVVCGTTAVRTSADEDFVTVDPAVEVSNGTWVLELAAMSLTTFTFERAAC